MSAQNEAANPDSAQRARLALFGFIITFIVARTVVLLIMSHRMPNLYFFLRGMHVHHLNYGIFLLCTTSRGDPQTPIRWMIP